jgi:hypothetical protein
MASAVVGQTCDMVPSIHDPAADFLLPFIEPFEEWQAANQTDEELACLISRQGKHLAFRATPQSTMVRSASAQAAPHDLDQPFDGIDLDWLVRAGLGQNPRGGPCDGNALLKLPAIRGSVDLFKRLRATMLDPSTQVGVDLEVSWQRFHPRGSIVSCVGSTAADLIERQRRTAFDPPSARYLAAASRELDGDRRPTTMIAAAGTSLRGVLAVARDLGHATESELPSQTDQPFPGELDAFYNAVNGRKADAVVNLNLDSKNLLGWLTLGLPATLAIQVGSAFLGTTGPDAVIAGEEPGEALFLHPLLVLGFKLVDELGPANWQEFFSKRPEDKKNDQKMPIYYRVRNSANPDWGDHGFGWLPQQVLLDQTQDAYGVLGLRPDEEQRHQPQGPPLGRPGLAGCR